MMSQRQHSLPRSLVALALLTALPATLPALAATQTAASGAIFWVGDGSYLSQANIPVGFYATGSPTFLDTLEDGTLDGNLSASSGTSVIGPGIFNGARDSVDADDGVIDGTCGPQGSVCASLFSGDGRLTITFQGSSLPTAFGLVWTDGAALINVTISAIDGQGNSLGSFTATGVGDNGNGGSTAEDRFMGVQFAGGVKSITIVNSGGGLEVDHIQYGTMAAVPEPASWLLMALGGVALVARQARWRGRPA